MSTKYYAVGQGKVYLATRDAAGVSSGYFEIGDADGLSISASQSFVDIYESQTGNRGIVAHIPSQLDMDVELSVLNLDGENLARAFYGESAVVTGAAVVGETGIAYSGQSIFLKYPGVSAVTVKKGATTLVLGTDYTLDTASGRIDFITGSIVITAGTAHTVATDYTHAGVAARVKGLTQGVKDYSIVFEGKSKFDDKVQVHRIHRAALNVAETLALIGTEVNKLVLKGKLLPATEQAAGESQYYTITQK